MLYSSLLKSSHLNRWWMKAGREERKEERGREKSLDSLPLFFVFQLHLLEVVLRNWLYSLHDMLRSTIIREEKKKPTNLWKSKRKRGEKKTWFGINITLNRKIHLKSQWLWNWLCNNRLEFHPTTVSLSFLGKYRSFNLIVMVREPYKKYWLSFFQMCTSCFHCKYKAIV